jgi:ribosome-binding protein aMBF1 (putative translation factor)
MEGASKAAKRANLDQEQRYFRIAARKASYYPRWLKRVRQAVGVHVTDMAKELEVNASVIYRLEKSEERKTISLKALEKMARAMGCKVVYAVIPLGGKTLMELAERLHWERQFKRERGKRKKEEGRVRAAPAADSAAS